MSTYDHIIAWIYATIGPTIFGAFLGSLSMTIFRRHSWREAVPSVIAALALAMVFGPLLAVGVSKWTGVEGDVALSAAAAVIALLGRDGVLALVHKYIGLKK